MRSPLGSLRPHTAIFAVALAAFVLAGCGVKKEEHEAVKSKLKEAESVIAQKETELTQLKAAVQALDQKVASLEGSDAIAYARIPPVERSGESAKAKELYEAFLASFPNSMLAPDAKAGIERVNQEAKKPAAAGDDDKKKEETVKRKKGDKTGDEKKKSPDEKKAAGDKTQKRFTPIKSN